MPIMMEPIPIYKGDNTDAFGVRTIRINLKTEVSLVGATATFTLLSFTKTFTSAEVQTKTFTITIDSAKTKGFPLGMVFGRLTLFDSQNRQMTASCNIPFKVVLAKGSMTGGWVKVDTGVAEITVSMGVDYEMAFNKPTINGIEVSGDKKGKDYDLNQILSYSQTSTYSVGDQVLNGGKFYACTTAITVPEAWNVAHWQEIGGGLDPNAVHYTEDTAKSSAEKSQARQNIGAASTADLALHTSNHNNPHQVTKAQVGLGNVDNTSDANKPVSTAQQAALDLKVAISALKGAFADPSDVKLSPASIKSYLTALYNAIQAI